MRTSCLFLSGLLVCALCEPGYAVSFTIGLPPGAAFADLAALNANYGLPDPSALTVEDFDDGILVSGLTITSNGGSSFVFPSVGSSAWHLDPSTYATWIMISPSNTLTIDLSGPGASLFAIGISDVAIEPGRTVSINGGAASFVYGADPNFQQGGGSARNGYLIIQTTVAGETINSVEFSGGSTESIDFDALQFQPIPEPSSLSLFALGLGGVTIVRRRRPRLIQGRLHPREKPRNRS